jgi:hypothetical protein
VLALAASTAGAQTVVVTSPPVKTVAGARESDGGVETKDVWLRNNVGGGASVGVAATYPRAGNGSMYMNGTSGTSKADAEYFFGGAVLSPFTLGSLTGASYDIYRSSTSTTAAAQNPSLRFFADADGDMTTTGDRGYLIYEGANNGIGAVALDDWTTMTIGASSNLWFRQFSPGYSDYCAVGNCPNGIGRPLSAYQSYTSPNGSVFSSRSLIYGVSSGIGSGWSGSFDGAVDNISVTQSGVTTTFNFEVSAQSTVPEPATVVLMGSGLAVLGFFGARRRSAK